MRRDFVVLFLLILCYGMQVFPQKIEYTRRSKNEVRDGPGSYYHLLKILPRGVAIPVMKRDAGWINFRPGDRGGSTSAWISQNCLVEGKLMDVLRDLLLEWKSTKASPSAAAAAIRGFALRYGRITPGGLDTLDDLQKDLLTPEEVAQFEVTHQGVRPVNQEKVLAEIDGLMKEVEPAPSEAGFGAGIAARLASQGLVTDRRVLAYVNLIAAKLVAVTPYYDMPFKVFVMKGEEPRAYAIPGGFIFLGEGLIHLCSDEAELAAVIGHEITHLTARHAMSEEFARRNRIRMDQAFSELEEELGAKPDSTEMEMEDLIQEAYDDVVKPRLQIYEEEADRGAAMLLAALGYDPVAVSTIVKKTGLAVKNRQKDWSQNPFLHLDFETRNQELLKFLQAHPGFEKGVRNEERFGRMTK